MISSNSWSLTVDGLSLLSDYCPILHGLYAKMSSISGDEPLKVFKNLIISLLDLCSATFEKENAFEVTEIDEKKLKKLLDEATRELNSPNETFTELWKTGEFFPNFPLKRLIPDVDIRDNDKKCSKNYHQSTNLAPGIIFFFCADHGDCVGFIVLQNSESPKTIMNAVFSRFNPSLLIYDNCCNLDEYILNRYLIH